MPNTRPVPQAKGDFLLGHLRPLAADPFRTLSNWWHDYGDAVGFRVLTRQFYMLSHPDMAEQALVRQADKFVKMYDPQKPKGLELVLGQGLVTSRGDLWRNQRRLMQPVFQRGNLSALQPQIVAAGREMLRRWHRLGDGAQVNLCSEMMRLTLEVITQTMFGTSVLDRIEAIAPALDTALRHAAASLLNPLSLPPFVPTPGNRAFNRAMATLDGVVYGIIEQRRTNPAAAGGDLLDMLLQARGKDSGAGMSDRQLRDEVLTIFSAGHETTSNLLSWTLYLLARHPDALGRLRRELQDLPAEEDWQFADLQTLEYCKAVLNESLRLRPPVGVIMRKIRQDAEVEGYRLAAGSLALINIFNLHHHPQFWKDPERFEPERFLGNQSRRFAFMPFGAGERICIGNHFALLESQLLLSLIVRNYAIELLDPGEADMEMVVSLRPKGGLPVRLKRLAKP
ncbi:cytochrome P450 [Methylomonas koyamae]|uniref:cytochrome P450 n=1 Tax=Methylomonas koyamae TaxID=702114 RepID=UPI00287301E5|nr:cytochrome P450 [Methylomonas koyamae]WNB76267.1 cytochrome P450 [Methylomonas koyamae]